MYLHKSMCCLLFECINRVLKYIYIDLSIKNVLLCVTFRCTIPVFKERKTQLHALLSKVEMLAYYQHSSIKTPGKI